MILELGIFPLPALIPHSPSSSSLASLSCLLMLCSLWNSSHHPKDYLFAGAEGGAAPGRVWEALAVVARFLDISSDRELTPVSVMVLF